VTSHSFQAGMEELMAKSKKPNAKACRNDYRKKVIDEFFPKIEMGKWTALQTAIETVLIFQHWLSISNRKESQK
jgi:hypothetical protein